MVKRFGPAIGGQVTGATVKGNKVTQLVNSRYTTGGGEKFLTPSAKFAMDEQKALAEAKRREKTIERLVREKEIRELEQKPSQIQQQFQAWFDKGYWHRNIEEGFSERDAILREDLRYGVEIDPEKLNQIIREQEKIEKITNFLSPYTVEPSGNLLKDFAAQMAASGRLTSDVLEQKADKAWKERQYGDSLIISTIAGVFGSTGKLVDPESTSGERSISLVLLGLDVGTGGRGSAGKQGFKYVEHALERMARDKISKEAVQDVIRFGEKYLDITNNRFIYWKGQIRVVVEKTGDIIVTAFKNNEGITNFKRFIKLE